MATATRRKKTAVKKKAKGKGPRKPSEANGKSQQALPGQEELFIADIENAYLLYRKDGKEMARLRMSIGDKKEELRLMMKRHKLKKYKTKDGKLITLEPLDTTEVLKIASVPKPKKPKETNK